MTNLKLRSDIDSINKMLSLQASQYLYSPSSSVPVPCEAAARFLNVAFSRSTSFFATVGLFEADLRRNDCQSQVLRLMLYPAAGYCL